MALAADRAKARAFGIVMDDPAQAAQLYAAAVESEHYAQTPPFMTPEEWDDVKKFIRYLWQETDALHRLTHQIEETA